jgi:hypothetical protein
MDVDQYQGQKRYIKAESLAQGKLYTLTIDRVVEEAMRPNESNPDPKPVLYFVGKQKGLPLNSTNLERIAFHTGQRKNIEHAWRGWTITIYRTTATFAGRPVDAIRVSDAPGSAWPPSGQAVQPTLPTPPPRQPPSPVSSLSPVSGFSTFQPPAANYISPEAPHPPKEPESDPFDDESEPERARPAITDDDVPF